LGIGVLAAIALTLGGWMAVGTIAALGPDLKERGTLDWRLPAALAVVGGLGAAVFSYASYLAAACARLGDRDRLWRLRLAFARGIALWVVWAVLMTVIASAPS
jgi:hypothetical protein